MKTPLDWLDSRTGCRKLIHTALYEHVPGGARWRYVWGSTLTFAIIVQFITGHLPLDELQRRARRARGKASITSTTCMPGGLGAARHPSFHGAAHGPAARPASHAGHDRWRLPRAARGELLVRARPARAHARDLAHRLSAAVGSTRLLGHEGRHESPLRRARGRATSLQRLVVGDANYGHHTLTRFFALHAGVLPALLVAAHRRPRRALPAPRPHRQAAQARARTRCSGPTRLLKDCVACSRC